MSWSCKILALLVLTGVASAVVMPQMIVPSRMAHEQPAGCHEHSQKSAPLKPVNYQCCQTGNYSAILQASSDMGLPLIATAHLLQVPIMLPTFGTTDLAPVSISSGGPPLSTSLRI
jgi:hypothetical protein